MVTALAARGLARENGVLGLSLLMPVKLGGMIGLACAYVFVMDWHLGAVLALVLGLAAIVSARRSLLRFDATAARHREGDEAEGVFGDWSIASRPCGPTAPRPSSATGYARRWSEPPAGDEAGAPPGPRRGGLGGGAHDRTPFRAGPGRLVLSNASGDGGNGGGLRAGGGARRLRDPGGRPVAPACITARALLVDLGKGLVPLKLRAALRGKAGLPESGALVAQGVSAYDPASGARVTAVNLNVAFPSHVALVGDGDAGPRLLAALMSGQIQPSLGRLTYGGVDLAAPTRSSAAGASRLPATRC